MPQVPQDRWEIINWGCEPGAQCPNPVSPEPALDPAASLAFMPRQFPPPHPEEPSTRNALVRAVQQAIAAESGCAVDQNPCYVTMVTYQEAHANVASRLRRRGFCAGQDEDGVSDHIYVSTNPPYLGLWLEIHEVCGGTPYVWCWGKVRKAAALWRIRQ